MKKLLVITLVLAAAMSSCKKKGCTDPAATNYNENATQDDGSCIVPVDYSGPKLIVKLHFDPNGERLDNFGNPSTIPATNSAQTPTFHAMSAHYIELAQTQLTQLGDGDVIYKGAETTAGGSNAVNFSQAIVKGDNETFVEIPLSSITPDTYNWLRVSLTYQNFDLDYVFGGNPYTGRLASFVGFNNYISSYTVQNEQITLNQNKLQGYWAVETNVLGTAYVTQGQSAATTVPNPLSATSPVPAGSCVVTGDFDVPFVFTGNETEDIVLTLNLSTNQSFEWHDDNQDGFYEPDNGDYPVDMGLRGLEPVISQ